MAQDKSNEPIGRYCVSVAESAIHYTKTDDWTPNNIKRLIISPDGVLVQLHTSKALIRRSFDIQKYNQCICDSRYKTMVSVLGGTGNNVCSHIEEIIYCLRGISGGVLHSSEANLRAIVSSSKVGTTENQLKRVIGERFKRLYAVVYFDGTANDLSRGYGAKLNDIEYHLGDEYTGGTVYIHKADWYRGYFFRPSYYKSDIENGLLYNHLHKIERDINTRLSRDKSDEIKSKILKDLKPKAEKEYKRCKLICKMAQHLGIMLNSKKARGYLQGEVFRSNDMILALTRHSNIAINDVFKIFGGSFKEDLIKSGVIFTEDKGDLRELAEQEVSVIMRLAIDTYTSVLRLYRQVLIYLKSEYPIMLNVLYSDSTEVFRKGITSVDGIEFGGIVELSKADIKTSMINICSQVETLLLADGVVEKYGGITYWERFVERVDKQ